MRRALAAGFAATLVCALIVADADARMRFGYRVGRRGIGSRTMRPLAPSRARHYKYHVPARWYPGAAVYYPGTPRGLREPGYECECDCYPSRYRGVHVRVNVAPRRRAPCCVTRPGTRVPGRLSHGSGLVIRHGH